MGQRARELFNGALAELRVESHPGLKPPLSCVKDGLQVATAASLGRGTIAVATNGPPACEAVFRYGEARLRLRLKPEFAKLIAADMAALEKCYGGTTPEYYQSVRGLSLKHWLNFDRTTMFEETMETAVVTPRGMHIPDGFNDGNSDTCPAGPKCLHPHQPAPANESRVLCPRLPARSASIFVASTTPR